jgi:hypothetical protein
MKSVGNSYALISSIVDLNGRGIHLRWSFSLSLFCQRGSSAESRMSCFHGMLLVPVSALAASGWSGAGSAPNNAIILIGLRCEAHTRRGCGRGLLRLWELRASVSLLILIGRRPSRVVGGIHPRHRARPRPRRRNLQIEGAASRFIGGLPERQKACVSKYWVD